MKEIIQQWQGYVHEIYEDSYWAVLKTMIGSEEDIECEILKSKTKDSNKLKIGTYITFNVYDDDSFIIEPIIEYWTKEQVDNINLRAKELFDVFSSTVER